MMVIVYVLLRFLGKSSVFYPSSKVGITKEILLSSIDLCLDEAKCDS